MIHLDKLYKLDAHFFKLSFRAIPIKSAVERCEGKEDGNKWFEFWNKKEVMGKLDTQ